MSGVRIDADDIAPLLGGLAILGTGGGGNPDWGRQILENDVRRGRTWNVTTLDEIADQATIVCAGMMGSVKAIESIGFATLLERWEQDFPLLTVVRAMEGLLGRRIEAVVPFEAGGLNSPVVLTLAARMGIPCVDGDALGRSAPETHMTSWHGHGVEITPIYGARVSMLGGMPNPAGGGQAFVVDDFTLTALVASAPSVPVPVRDPRWLAMLGLLVVTAAALTLRRRR